jgi:hypothetical protein
VLSESLVIPFSEPVTAKEHEFELPPEVFRSHPAPVVVLDVPGGVNQVPHHADHQIGIKERPPGWGPVVHSEFESSVVEEKRK